MSLNFSTTMPRFPTAQLQQPIPRQQQEQVYSGQWTKEEQDYVTILMEGFKNGSLDIADGTSLRFFIAAKLGCKPKRVSKKYERSGYNGKQVYRRNADITDEEQDAYRQRLKDAETKFKSSRALVVSMQEAKTGPATSGTPIFGLGGGSGSQAAMDDRLAAMRSQIDLVSSRFGITPRFPTSGFGASGMAPLNPLVSAAPLSPDMIQQAMMLQRGLPGATAGLGLASSVGGPANKLLVDLYQRRQQLAFSAVAAGAAGSSSLMLPPQMTSASGLGSPKRGLEETEGESQANKRARAA